MDTLDKIIKENINKLITESSDKFVSEIGYKKHIDVVRIDEADSYRISQLSKYGMAIVSTARDKIHDEEPRKDLSNEYNEFLMKNHISDSDKNQTIFLKRRNKYCDKELKETLKASPFTFTSVYGGYQEDGISTFEPSYIIFNRNKSEKVLDFEELYKFALELGTKYKQDSVYIQAPNEAPHYVNPTNGEIMDSKSSNNFSLFNTNNPYFSTAKRKKNSNDRFTADIQFESLYKKRYGTLFERMLKREKYGELFI